MSTNPPTIFLSTSQAAKLIGCESHVLYSNFARHGHYSGVIPRKGAKGRLSWPADQIRESIIPPTDTWPSGMNAWLDYVAVRVPEIDRNAAFNLGLVLLGSEATMGWVASPGQLTEERLITEAGLVGMFAQALGDRHDEAQTKARRPIATRAFDWLAGCWSNRLGMPAPEGVSHE